MASPRLKEIKDLNDTKDIVDTIHYIPPKLIPDPIGPVKLDAFDRIMSSYLQLMPKVAQRIDSMEAYLEEGVAEGKPYVRSDERPEVGAGTLNELVENIRLIDQRLSKLESTRKG